MLFNRCFVCLFFIIMIWCLVIWWFAVLLCFELIVIVL